MALIEAGQRRKVLWRRERNGLGPRLVVPGRSLRCPVGPSGCGKTATLQMTQGGSNWYREGPSPSTGAHVTRVPPHKRDVAMFDSCTPLYPNKTVYDNMAYASGDSAYPREETARRVRRMFCGGNAFDRRSARPQARPACQVASVSGWLSVPPLSVSHEPSCSRRAVGDVGTAKLGPRMRWELNRSFGADRLEATFVPTSRGQVGSYGDGRPDRRDERRHIAAGGDAEEMNRRPRLASWQEFAIGSPPMNLLSARI